MKIPPLLLGAALLFWGWQTELFLAGAVMAVVVETSRFISARWEFSDEEFRRIWLFCSMTLLAVLVYAFNVNQGPASFSELFDDLNLSAQTHAGTAGARTVIAILRWSPMIFFLFVAAQAWSAHQEIPVATISIFLWRRRKRALRMGRSLGEERKFNPSYPFFGLCLLAASIHPYEGQGFFLGFCALITWMLWPHRSRRLNPIAWAGVLAAALVLGQLGQTGLNQLQRAITSRGAQWLAEFFQRGVNPYQNTTAIGQIGRINASGKIVIRLETKPGLSPPQYLREASYRRFRLSVWYADKQQDFETVNYETTNVTTWVLITNKPALLSVNIACYLPGGRGLLPLPTGYSRLENLAAYTLATNSLGAALAEGQRFLMFDAHYNPMGTIDSMANKDGDLDVATNEVSTLHALDAMIKELQVDGLTTRQKLSRLQNYFETNFTYSVWQEPPKRRDRDESPLSRFLLQTHSGHCEYFATATVLLLRKMGIPARYAIGYAVHEGAGNKYVVRQRDGHAWCLAWDERSHRWIDFDTTPASRFEEEDRRASSFQWLSDAWSRVRFEISKIRWGHSWIRKYILWALVPVLILLLYQIIFRKSWRRRARKSGKEHIPIEWPGRDSEFYKLERRLAEFIGDRRADEPLSDWLKRAAADPALTAITESVRELLRLHYRYRFDPIGLNEPDRVALKEAVRVCLKNLAGADKSPR